MALLTLSVAGAGLAASTMLLAASSRVEPAEAGPDVIVCEDIVDGYQRTVPADAHCSPRAEVEVPPTP